MRFLLIALLLLLSACNGADGPSAAESDLLVTLDSICEAAHRCRDSYAGTPPFMNVYGNTLAECGSTNEIVARIAGDAITDERTRYDADESAACRAYVDSVQCDRLWNGGAEPSCDAMLIGLAPAESPCTFGWECASDRCTAEALCD
ncbi:hypothetical protein [Sandaracinus amylolyticus]|uniref:Lipoprotein n=1 Tax=Sandaracinus amylolyticus TaxID=927083 RepID=A0A0F6SF63_9BACT|nr:hypothetical protein [Sandaracinus amylolyticus]AKF06394.1 hypothetical protein DB32_003543 [Sandaracinus amylolyticus]